MKNTHTQKVVRNWRIPVYHGPVEEDLVLSSSGDKVDFHGGLVKNDGINHCHVRTKFVFAMAEIRAIVFVTKTGEIRESARLKFYF